MINDLIINRPYGGYNMIVADPPWRFELYNDETGKEKSPQAQYECMSLDDIKKMPIGQLAAKNSILWLWVTNPMLREGIEVLEAWGFEYATAGAWAKKTVNNKYRWGTGYVLRSTHEPFLIGKRGKPKTSRSIPSCFDGLAREHSRKPDEGYAFAEKMIKDARRLDLFSRQDRDGWTNWGFEKDKFNEDQGNV